MEVEVQREGARVFGVWCSSRCKKRRETPVKKRKSTRPRFRLRNRGLEPRKPKKTKPRKTPPDILNAHASEKEKKTKNRETTLLNDRKRLSIFYLFFKTVH
jgi:hypothetical protein